MGSLNAFRAVLVAVAAVAMFASFALGNVAAGLWLLLGITMHTLLWVYLWREKKRDVEQLPALDADAEV